MKIPPLILERSGLVQVGKPWVLQCLHCCWAPLWIDLKQTFHEIDKPDISNLQLMLQRGWLGDNVFQLVCLLVKITWYELKCNFMFMTWSQHHHAEDSTRFFNLFLVKGVSALRKFIPFKGTIFNTLSFNRKSTRFQNHNP